MSFVIKKKGKKGREEEKEEVGECNNSDKKYDKKCGTNKQLLQSENENRIDLKEHPEDH